ncbi:MAG: hypothetical protein VX475_14725, partial [Myxococcota bacterium]|nr:hypothetical protein [Myxococcota bacterium]
ESGITGTFLKGLNNYYEGFAEVARAKYELDVLVLDVTSRDIRKGEGRDWFIDQATAFFADRRQSSLF